MPFFYIFFTIFTEGEFVYSTEAFLFSLNNPDQGPTFGSGYDLYIADKCDKNTNSYSNLGDTYKLPTGYTYGNNQSLLAASYYFKVDEYEVFFQPGKFPIIDRKIK